MKKNSRSTTPIMRRIITLEKHRLLKTLSLFIGVFATLFMACIVVSLAFIQDVRDLGTWDVLSLFWEDREIIAEYWQDALSTFWLEVPMGYMYIFLGISILSLIFVYFTREKRKNLKNRSQKLASYEKTSTLVSGGKQK
ncbi:MAG: hypothetical protein AAB492_01825 [Patescibacteria group bacterium]